MWPWKSTKAEPIQQQDDVLGTIEYGEGDWTGLVRHGKHDVELSIAGDLTGPDPIARQLVVDALPRLAELFH